MTISKYTKELLKPLVENSTSYRDLVLRLGRKYTGGNYQYIKSIVEKQSLDTSHFTGKGWNKGNKSNSRLLPSEYLIKYPKDKLIKTNRIKLLILRDKIKEYKCESCGKETWLENPIPLEIHHKDGNRNNCQLDNLELLCPNCHALTENYRGKKNKLA